MILPAAPAASPATSAFTDTGGQAALAADPNHPQFDFKKLQNLLAALLSGAVPATTVAATPAVNAPAHGAKNGSNATAVSVISSNSAAQVPVAADGTPPGTGQNPVKDSAAPQVLVAGPKHLPSLVESATSGNTTRTLAVPGDTVVSENTAHGASLTLSVSQNGAEVHTNGLPRTAHQTPALVCAADSHSGAGTWIKAAEAGVVRGAPLLAPGDDASTALPVPSRPLVESLTISNLPAGIQSASRPETTQWLLTSLETENQQSKKSTTETAGTPESSGAITGSAPAPGSASAPQPSAPSAAEQIGNGVLAHLATFHDQGRTEFRINLNPPDLGPVRVHLSAADGQVSARLVVREDATRQLLQSQLDTLLQRLSGAGIALGRFDVSQEGAGFQWQGHDPRPQAVPAAMSASATVSVAAPTVAPIRASGIDVVA